MCDPVSAMFAAQAAIGAAGALSAGSSQAKAANANAAAFEVQAANRMEKAEFDTESQDRQYRRVAGERDKRIAKSGGSAESFSDVVADDLAESELEQAATLWSARNEADNIRFQASGQRQQAKDAKTASYINAAGAVVNAASGYVRTQKPGVSTAGTFSQASGSYGDVSGGTGPSKTWGYM